MKNKSIALMLVLAGLVGCRGNDDDGVNSKTPALVALLKRATPQQKPSQTDTVYVLGAMASYSTVYISAVDKDGKLFFVREKFAEKSVATNVGDTLVLSRIDMYGTRALSRNLTMENKIQEIVAASKHR